METRLEQGTEEWLRFRKGKLTASKAGVILGLSPYMTPFELFEEELGLREPKTVSSHMQAGLDIEGEARDWFYNKTGIEVIPDVAVYPKEPIFIASLDGISKCKSTILEIKNNNKEFHEIAKRGKIVPFHFAQVQHQMYVTDLDECNYLSYRKGDEILLSVGRDELFITDMIQKELDFKKCLDDLIPPALIERDYEDMSHDLELSEWGRLYFHYDAMKKDYESKAEYMKEQIKNRIGIKNVKAEGFKMTKYSTKGRVDWELLKEKHCPEIDENQYRKSSTVSFRISKEV